MARNRIQFQKGLSEARFQALYGDEERCRALVIDWRWPDGFICPKCRGRACCVVGSRRLFQCNSCHHQASPTAGTIFDSTKLPLTVWFRAMYLITQTKQGISSIELGRRLGTTQTTAWKIKTKLAEVMRLDNDRTPLEGRVEMDDAYLGGKRSGGKTGRGSPRFKRKRVKSLAKRIIAQGAFVVTDGLACFRGVADAGREHHPIVTGASRHGAGHPSFHWLNTVLANIKTAIVATYKAVRKKHLARTLAEFEWRFNNRENLAAMIPVLACAAARSIPA